MFPEEATDEHERLQHSQGRDARSGLPKVHDGFVPSVRGAFQVSDCLSLISECGLVSETRRELTAI